MFIRFFRSNSPAAFLFLPLIALAIWAAGFVEPVLLPLKHTMPLYELLSSVVRPVPWLGILISAVLVIGEAFLLNYMVNENEVLPKQSYLPAFFYILLMGNSNAMLSLHPLIPANLFMIFALNRLLSSYRKDAAFAHAFDAGLLISLATLFYFPYIVFFPLLGAAFIILRPFNWREWIISFFGVMIPYLFTMAVYFWKEELDYLLYDKMLYPLIAEKTRLKLPPSYYVLMGLGLIILVLSLGKLVSLAGGGPQRTKKGIVLMVWFFIFCGLSVLIAPEISARYFAALAIPVSIFYSFYFMNLKREWLGELLCLLFVGTLALNLILHYF